jgi:hypothetical protein
MAQRLMSGLAEVASIGVFLCMIFVWAALGSGPGV